MFKLYCQNLEFSYPHHPAFRLLVPELDCKLSEPLGVYGLTGSGKSTFGKILGGLLNPDSGSFRIESSEPAESSQNAATRILYLPQFPESIFLGMSVTQALKTMLKGQFALAEIVTKFDHNLKRLGLDYNLIRNRFGYELSAGELRLATIALGLTVAADLTIFDEPTIALSRRGRNRFIELIEEFAVQKALMIISHDYHLVRKLCPKVLIFAQGKMLFKGEWKELDRNAFIRKSVGLDLLEVIPQMDVGNEKESV